MVPQGVPAGASCATVAKEVRGLKSEFPPWFDEFAFCRASSRKDSEINNLHLTGLSLLFLLQ